MVRRSPPALLAFVLAVAFVVALGCSTTSTPAGLEVIVETDLARSEYGSVWIQVSQRTASLAWKELVNEQLKGALPGRFAIAAGSSADQDVLLTVTAYATTGASDGGPGTAPLVRRTEQVQVPTTYVAQLDVNLSPARASCPGQYEAVGGPPTCTIDLLDAGPLPTYKNGTETFDAGRYDATLPRDAGEGRPDAHTVDARRPHDAADARTATDAHDAGRPVDATTATDAHEAGADAHDAAHAHDARHRHDAKHAEDAAADASDASDAALPPAPSLTAISPDVLYAPSTVTVTLTGSGFETHGAPTVTGVVSNSLEVTTSNATVESDSTMTVALAIAEGAPTAFAYTLAVENAGGVSAAVGYAMHKLWTVTTFTDSSPGDAGTGGGSPGDLRSALVQAGAGDEIAIDCPAASAEASLLCTIQLQGPLPPISADLIITGGGFADGGSPASATIDGAGLYRVFFVESGAVSIANLTIENALAQGGAGGVGDTMGGGGGLGAGAGLFIDSAAAAVTLSNVTFVNMAARGGAGGEGGPGIRTGLGGGGGGGGGLAFAGGGGSPNASENGGGGGGGGGVLGAGETVSGQLGGQGGAGGGGGGATNNDGSGFVSGGTSYGTAAAGLNGSEDTPGAGGFGGGGGGGAGDGTGGAGGFGGGGGGAPSSGGAAGSGGAGGGGGGGGTAGQGGPLATIAGGGGGSTASLSEVAPGGGGAAAGPAIFVNEGSLTYSNLSVQGSCTATGGAAGTGQGMCGGPYPCAYPDVGGADPSAIFNVAGTVNGGAQTGGLPP